MLQTDYLVIGAGAASMAFVDTLLTEDASCKIMIVDKHLAPGGHWNDAYGFVHLHQPSLLYGVASSQMEGNWGKLVLKGTLPWNHRASKSEILAYYKKLMDTWTASGRVSYYPNCTYDFEKSNTNQQVHSFHSLDDSSTTYNVKVSVKLVNGILGECQVPSKTPPAFGVGNDVNIMTPNQVYDKYNTKSSWFSRGSSVTDSSSQKYVVLGAGKTAMDTVVYLQRQGGIQADNIVWVIPNDVWIIAREGPGTPWSWGEALLKNDMNAEQAALELERKGVFTRVDTKVTPTRFRFPVVGKDEMKLLRKVKNVIRQGRVTSIDSNGRVEFARGEPVVLDSKTHTFVHCTSPGPFNGNTNVDIFPSDKEIRLNMLYAPPVPVSMASIAVLEGRRRAGTLDLDFGRTLLQTLDGTNDSKKYSDNDVLQQLITSISIADKNNATDNLEDQVKPLKVFAFWIAIFGKNPMTAYKWLCNNRLSFFSIPNFKGRVYETVVDVVQRKQSLGLSANETTVLEMVAEKLKPLEGK